MSSGLSSSITISSSDSAVTNSTLNPNSSATIDKVSASNLWFNVTIIPNVIQAEMISVVDTSIIVAISLAVTNSVTFRILLSFSWAAISSSDFNLCKSRLSFLYFAALPLTFFPWSFSKVSLICCWTSSSDGSSLTIFLGLLLFLSDENLSLDISLFWGTILLLLLLAFDCDLSSDLFNSSKFIFSPVAFIPDSFL